VVLHALSRRTVDYQLLIFIFTLIRTDFRGSTLLINFCCNLLLLAIVLCVIFLSFYRWHAYDCFEVSVYFSNILNSTMTGERGLIRFCNKTLTNNFLKLTAQLIIINDIKCHFPNVFVCFINHQSVLLRECSVV